MIKECIFFNVNKINMVIKCDKYCNHNEHPFIYELSSTEKKYLQTVLHSHIYMNKNIPKIHNELQNLINKLNEHFDKNPTKKYFLRLNKLSPKDAYYIINNNFDNNDNNDNDKLTIEDIKRDLELLNVGNILNRKGDYCINILLNSDRVYCELAFSDINENISVLLLDFKNINHKSETRCYINNNKIVAISQYYSDLSDIYDFDIEDNIIDKIKKYIDYNIKNDLKDYVVDIYFDNNKNIHIIELNSFSDDTDSCLFDWKEIYNSPYEFRYKKNFEIKRLNYKSV